MNTEKETTAAAKRGRKRRTGADKLTSLVEQRDNLIEVKNTHNKKGREIENQLAEVNGKIREYQFEKLEKVCEKKKITISELAVFLDSMPENVSLTELFPQKNSGGGEQLKIEN